MRKVKLAYFLVTIFIVCDIATSVLTGMDFDLVDIAPWIGIEINFYLQLDQHILIFFSFTLSLG